MSLSENDVFVLKVAGGYFAFVLLIIAALYIRFGSTACIIKFIDGYSRVQGLVCK
jgi:hypothetical protein